MLSGEHKKLDVSECFERKIFTTKKLYANLGVCGGSGGHLRFDNDLFPGTGEPSGNLAVSLQDKVCFYSFQDLF